MAEQIVIQNVVANEKLLSISKYTHIYSIRNDRRGQVTNLQDFKMSKSERFQVRKQGKQNYEIKT